MSKAQLLTNTTIQQNFFETQIEKQWIFKQLNRCFLHANFKQLIITRRSSYYYIHRYVSIYLWHNWCALSSVCLYDFLLFALKDFLHTNYLLPYMHILIYIFTLICIPSRCYVRLFLFSSELQSSIKTCIIYYHTRLPL